MGSRLQLRYGACIAAILLLDGLTKAWFRNDAEGVHTLIPGLIRILVVRNRGFFQGILGPELGSGAPWLSLLVAGIALALLTLLAWRSPAAKTARHLGFACMIGGALSNSLDRLIHGYVLDLIQIGPLGVYNFADFALLGGAGVVLADYWRKDPGGPTPNASDSL